MKIAQRTQKTPGTQRTDVVCVVGLGYVGFPLAQSFSRSCKVIGFDNDAAVIARHETPASVIASEARQSEETWSLRGAKPRGNLQQSPKNSMNSTNSINSINSINCGMDAVVVAVAHDAFKEIILDKLKTITNANPILY